MMGLAGITAWPLGRLTLLFLVVMWGSGCGQDTKVTRVDSGVVTDLSGRWNDTDSRMVAEAMVKDALEYPWLNQFTSSNKRQPVVVVGTIVNESSEHISVQTFVTDLERELTDTQKAPGKEIGADYMMKGTISSILDEVDGTKAVFYQVDLQMIDLESNAKVWFGQKKIKKVVEKKRAIF